MTDYDRKMIELAATAAGYKIARWTDDNDALLLVGVQKPWNPLVDEHDAFLLCCHLEIDILFTHDDVEAIATQYAQPEDQELISPWACENFQKQDKATAAKRAIVRAAAAIQGQKKEQK
jgi:hypothetical protein